MIQRLNRYPGHDQTLNNDSVQDSGDNFPNETQIMNNISQFREELPIWRKSPILRIFTSCGSEDWVKIIPSTCKYINFEMENVLKLCHYSFCMPIERLNFLLNKFATYRTIS